MELELTKFIDEADEYLEDIPEGAYFMTPGLPDLNRALEDAAALRAAVRRVHDQME